MRVLNTTTKTFEEITYYQKYAILSHCWGDEEVQLQDMFRPNEWMKGYAKLSAACDTALHLGFDYLWMDTCCIDKSSSSELSEAINSMYNWYKRAVLCIVYLHDVDGERWKQQLKESRWFKRGWTLQELIAPSMLFFFDKDWTLIRTKASIAEELASITGIDEDVLLTGNTEGISIAAKMSWAAERQTTRSEDRAYSLMGIFNVNMPTIYGEGDKAFVRLQEEIIKQSDDQSIFAWDVRGNTQTQTQDALRNPPAWYTGMLARGPYDFKDKSNVVQSRSGDALHPLASNAEFTSTNRGIRIRLPVQPANTEYETYIAFLACASRVGDCVAYGIPLHKISDNQYIRFSYSEGGNLIEIQNFEEDDMRWQDFIFIAQRDLPMHTPFMHSGPGLIWARIHLAPLNHALEPYNLTLCDKSDHNSVLNLASAGEQFLFIISPAGEAMTMLVMTFGQKSIDVKVVAPEASDDPNQPTLQQMFETWYNEGQLPDLQGLSHSVPLQMPDGQEIELIALPVSHLTDCSHQLCALPVSTSLQSE